MTCGHAERPTLRGYVKTQVEESRWGWVAVREQNGLSGGLEGQVPAASTLGRRHQPTALHAFSQAPQHGRQHQPTSSAFAALLKARLM